LSQCAIERVLRIDYSTNKGEIAVQKRPDADGGCDRGRLHAW